MAQMKSINKKAVDFFYMEGNKVFKLASHMLIHSNELLLAKTGLTIPDIDWVVPHQASLLAMHHFRKRFKIPVEKLVTIYETHGNQMAASLPSALSHYAHANKIKRVQLLYLIGTGAGISSTGLVMEY